MSKNDDSFLERLQHGWNAFRNRDPVAFNFPNIGYGDSRRPDRVRLTTGNERSIISSVYTRIAIDAASMSIRHVHLDEDGRYESDIKSSLNDCLTIEANADQTGRAMMQDFYMSLFDEGSVAVVPVETTFNPDKTDAYDILSLRVAKILQWYPEYIKVSVYNEKTGKKEDLTLPKKDVVIVENPLYAVMNEPNSTLSRLIYKLNLLDAIDTQSGSGKLDLIIQLPYVIKSAARKEQAEQRRKDIEFQLSGSKYGIAYTDGTEKITQLNRPAENNLMKQIEYLTSMLYSQLGMTVSIFDGTADEKTMINYFNKTLEPLVASFVDEARRKFLTKTARSQRQSIMFFRDPFRLVPVNELAEIADKFTRNEVLTSNEVRAVIGFKPSSDPKANQLQNKNINAIPESPDNLEKKKEVKVNAKKV